MGSEMSWEGGETGMWGGGYQLRKGRGVGRKKQPQAGATQAVGRPEGRRGHGRRARVPPCAPAGACAFLALLLHALEMQSLRMKPNPPHFSVQWPYYALGFSILLFAAAGECSGWCPYRHPLSGFRSCGSSRVVLFETTVSSH